MSLQVINGTTVTRFIEDRRTTFDIYVQECFQKLDVDGDGVLSRKELRQGFRELFALECETLPEEEVGAFFDAIFERFDEDRSGTIDGGEFGCFMVEIMLAVARGIGNSQVLMALDVNSLLMKAVEHEFRKES